MHETKWKVCVIPMWEAYFFNIKGKKSIHLILNTTLHSSQYRNFSQEKTLTFCASTYHIGIKTFTFQQMFHLLNRQELKIHSEKKFWAI